MMTRFAMATAAVLLGYGSAYAQARMSVSPLPALGMTSPLGIPNAPVGQPRYSRRQLLANAAMAAKGFAHACPLKPSSKGERSRRLRLNSGKGFGANRKMLIDVLAQQHHCRNVTLRKSYNRAVVETGSGTYAPICLNVQLKPSPGRMAAPNSLRPGLSFRRHLRF